VYFLNPNEGAGSFDLSSLLFSALLAYEEALAIFISDVYNGFFFSSLATSVALAIMVKSFEF